MLDVDGRPLEVGDIVAATWGKYPDLRVGTVVIFTPKKIVVGFHGQYLDGSLYEELKFQTQVCFIRKNNIV